MCSVTYHPQEGGILHERKKGLELEGLGWGLASVFLLTVVLGMSASESLSFMRWGKKFLSHGFVARIVCCLLVPVSFSPGVWLWKERTWRF